MRNPTSQRRVRVPVCNNVNGATVCIGLNATGDAGDASPAANLRSEALHKYSTITHVHVSYYLSSIPFSVAFPGALPLHTARGPGVHCKLPQRGPGAEPRPKRNLVQSKAVRKALVGIV